MLYHYTDRYSGADVLREGLLRAHPVLVRTSLLPWQGKEAALAPAVWFTVRGEPAPTVFAKMQLGGWPLDRPGMVWRFGLDEQLPDLPEWAHGHGYPPDTFRFMLLTAQLAGEDWEDWRLAGEDVPAGRWSIVQWLDGKIWRDNVR